MINLRKSSVACSMYQFKVGPHKLNYVDSYKYLGFYFDEYINLIKGVKFLVESAGRALGGNIGKSKKFEVHELPNRA